LFAAFLQPGKGVFDSLKAYASHIKRYPDSIYTLKLLGGYTEDVYSRISKFINENGLDGKVEISGKVLPEVVNANLRLASITFIPSFSEGFGRTMAEAMFNGCLVAGRNTGGTKEQFDNGLRIIESEIGLRFDTVEEMAATMNQNYEKGVSGYEEMIISSQKVVSKLCTIESNYTQIDNLYKAILDE